MQIPPYPDAGVSFAGFSKTLNGTTYKLNKQNAVVCNVQLLSIDSSKILLNVPRGKAFYMTDLIIERFDNGITDLYLTDGPLAAVAGVFMDFEVFGPSSNAPRGVFHFSVPIKFVIAPTLTIGLSGSQIYFNAVGWLEDA